MNSPTTQIIEYYGGPSDGALQETTVIGGMHLASLKDRQTGAAYHHTPAVTRNGSKIYAFPGCEGALRRERK